MEKGVQKLARVINDLLGLNGHESSSYLEESVLTKNGIVFTEKKLGLVRLHVLFGGVKVAGSSHGNQLHNHALGSLSTHLDSSLQILR